MTQFAGSRHLGERRRRRLAADADEVVLAVAEAVSMEESSEPPPPAPPLRSLVVPVHGLVPRSGWVHGLLALGVIGLALAIAFAGQSVSRLEGQLGPGFAYVFSPENGIATRVFASTLLLFSGQLALLVWWVRSQSVRDFDGRYDAWAWAAGGWFVFALAVATESHRAWSATVGWLWFSDRWHEDVLSWFAPAVGLGAVLWNVMRQDMRRCVLSRCVGWLAVLCWLAAGAMQMGLASPNGEGWSDGSVALAVVLAAALGFESMLLHLWYTVYVCNDPPSPSRKPSRARRRRKRKAEDDEPAEPSDADEGASTTRESRTAAEEAPESAPGEPDDDPPSRKPKPGRRKSARRADRSSEPDANGGDSESSPEPDAPEDASDREQQTESDASHAADGSASQRVDGPDPETLKGLSKKQRRKVRKQWRERQRAKAAAGS